MSSALDADDADIAGASMAWRDALKAASKTIMELHKMQRQQQRQRKQPDKEEKIGRSTHPPTGGAAGSSQPMPSVVPGSLLGTPSAIPLLNQIQAFLEFCADNLQYIFTTLRPKWYSVVIECLVNICQFDVPQSAVAAVYLQELTMEDETFLRLICLRLKTSPHFLEPVWNITCAVDERVKKRLRQLGLHLSRECPDLRPSWKSGLAFQQFEPFVSRIQVPLLSVASAVSRGQQQQQQHLQPDGVIFCQSLNMGFDQVPEPKRLGISGICVALGKRRSPVDVFAYGEISIAEQGLEEHVKYSLEFDFLSEERPLPVSVAAWHEKVTATASPSASGEGSGSRRSRSHSHSVNHAPASPPVEDKDLTTDEHCDVRFDMSSFRYSEKLCIPFFLAYPYPSIKFRMSFVGDSGVALMKIRLSVLSKPVSMEDSLRKLGERETPLPAADDRHSVAAGARSGSAPHARHSAVSMKSAFGLEPVLPKVVLGPEEESLRKLKAEQRKAVDEAEEKFRRAQRQLEQQQTTAKTAKSPSVSPSRSSRSRRDDRSLSPPLPHAPTADTQNRSKAEDHRRSVARPSPSVLDSMDGSELERLSLTPEMVKASSAAVAAHILQLPDRRCRDSLLHFYSYELLTSRISVHEILAGKRAVATTATETAEEQLPPLEEEDVEIPFQF